MTDRPPLKGLWHAALNVADVEASLRFYRDVLGMQVEWRPDADNVYLTSGRDNLALHKGPSPAGAQALDHLGFVLPTPEAVDAWAAYLTVRGFAPEKPVRTHRDGARSFYVRDPGGVLVQFIHHPPLEAV
ncbi:MAG: VOC family protein [Planctomycetota bacterium]|nr:MAG: VOC family protein [Planctomycetota bacterium]